MSEELELFSCTACPNGHPYQIVDERGRGKISMEFDPGI